MSHPCLCLYWNNEMKRVNSKAIHLVFFPLKLFRKGNDFSEVFMPCRSAKSANVMGTKCEIARYVKKKKTAALLCYDMRAPFKPTAGLPFDPLDFTTNDWTCTFLLCWRRELGKWECPTSFCMLLLHSAAIPYSSAVPSDLPSCTAPPQQARHCFHLSGALKLWWGLERNQSCFSLFLKSR